MSFKLNSVLAQPSQEMFNLATRADLLVNAAHFGVTAIKINMKLRIQFKGKEGEIQKNKLR